MRTPAVVTTFVAGLLIGAPPAPAQTVIAQGGYSLDVRSFSAEQGEEVLDGRAGNLSLAVAGFVASHVSVGVEWDLGGTSTESRTVTVTLPGRPATITTTYLLRRRTVSALAGLHTAPGRRVRLGGYAGLTFNAVRREVSADAPPIVLDEPPGPSVFLDRTTAPVVGADLAVTVAARVALVATLRAQGLTLAGDAAGFSIRPGAAVRVLF